ncbi:unnamed protein product, partial [Nesidiocoris tenuis]
TQRCSESVGSKLAGCTSQLLSNCYPISGEVDKGYRLSWGQWLTKLPAAVKRLLHGGDRLVPKQYGN